MGKVIIALDADGVLLDYGLAYAGAWERAFGQYPRERDPQAYLRRFSAIFKGTHSNYVEACF
jgi:beta-phosphoglucomutase-like phosphatase (HAD superfamily)